MEFNNWAKANCVRGSRASCSLSELYADYLGRCAKGEAYGRHYFKRLLQQYTPRGRWSLCNNRLVRVGIRLVDSCQFPTNDGTYNTILHSTAAEREHWRKMS